MDNRIAIISLYQTKTLHFIYNLSSIIYFWLLLQEGSKQTLMSSSGSTNRLQSKGHSRILENFESIDRFHCIYKNKR